MSNGGAAAAASKPQPYLQQQLYSQQQAYALQQQQQQQGGLITRLFKPCFGSPADGFAPNRITPAPPPPGQGRMGSW